MITVIAMILSIIGAINWGIIGVSGFNLVAWICYQNVIAQSIIYILVGVSALWLIAYLICSKFRVGMRYSCPETGEERKL